MSLALALTISLMAAQASAPSRPTTEQIAAARATADAIIKQANAADLFTNVTSDSGVPAVRHRLSGMTCTFSGSEGSYVQVFPEAGGLKRGEDVACGTRIMGAEHTTYATRYPDGHSAADDLQAAVHAIVQRLPDARPYTGVFPIATRDGGPEVLGNAFVITVNGEARLTLVLVSKVGEWNLKRRATGELSSRGNGGKDESILPLMAGLDFLGFLPGASAGNDGSGEPGGDL